MKINLFRIMLVVCAALIASLAVTCSALKEKKKEAERLEGNQSVLLSKIRQFAVRDSLKAAEVGTLQLTLSEYEKYRQADAAIIRDLGLKLKRVESAASVQANTTVNVAVPVKDSIVYIRGKTDTLRCINYIDDWNKLSGCVVEKKFIGEFSVKESLKLFINYTPKKFLFIKYGIKEVKASAVSLNPKTEIVGVEVVRFTRD